MSDRKTALIIEDEERLLRLMAPAADGSCGR